MAQKVSRYFGYYCRKICQQDLSKIAQSGHTGRCHLLLLNQFDKDKWAPRVVLETFSPLGTYLPMLACCCFCSHIIYSVFIYTLFLSFLFPICIQCFSTSPLLSLSLSLSFLLCQCMFRCCWQQSGSVKCNTKHVQKTFKTKTKLCGRWAALNRQESLPTNVID